MAEGFDVVALGVDHESAVVVGVLVRARTGCAVVLAVGLDGVLVRQAKGVRAVVPIKGDAVT